MNDQYDSVGEVTRISAVIPRQWVLRSMDTGMEFVLQGDMLVGREAECQISIPSGHISRYHAKILVTNAGVILEDLNSTNGTFVNGRRLTSPKVLSLGDEVVFHTDRYRLVSGRSGEAEATMMFSAPPRVAPAGRLSDRLQQRMQESGIPSSAPVARNSPVVNPLDSAPVAVAEAAKPSVAETPAAVVASARSADVLSVNAQSAVESHSEQSVVTNPVDVAASEAEVSAEAVAESIPVVEHSASVQVIDPEVGDPADFELPVSFRSQQEAVVTRNVPDDATRILSGSELANKADRARQHAAFSASPRAPGSGPRLVVMSAPLRGKVFPLSDQKLATTWRIGRGESCEMRVNDVTVSHDHARIVRSSAGWQIAVTSARNALVVNGEVQTTHSLQNGDRLLLGRMELVFATDVDEMAPILVAPEPTLNTRPWIIGVAVFAAVAVIGGVIALLM